MEARAEKLNGLIKEMDSLQAYYARAEKLYDYSNLEGGDAELPANAVHKRRLQSTEFETNQQHFHLLSGTPMLFGFSTMIFASKMLSKSSGLADPRCITKNPARSLAFFFYGVAASAIFTYSCIPKTENDALNHRVNDNQRAHNLISVLKFHLETKVADFYTGRE